MFLCFSVLLSSSFSFNRFTFWWFLFQFPAFQFQFSLVPLVACTAIHMQSWDVVFVSAVQFQFQRFPFQFQAFCVFMFCVLIVLSYAVPWGSFQQPF